MTEPRVKKESNTRPLEHPYEPPRIVRKCALVEVTRNFSCGHGHGHHWGWFGGGRH